MSRFLDKLARLDKLGEGTMLDVGCTEYRVLFFLVSLARLDKLGAKKREPLKNGSLVIEDCL